MGKKFNQEKLKDFLFRRKLNFLSLLAITVFSVVVTLVCLITGYIPSRVFILVIVSALLVLLCVIQLYRMSSSFRTIRAFKGKRKKKKN